MMIVVCSVEDASYWRKLQPKPDSRWVSSLADAKNNEAVYITEPVDPNSLLSFCDKYSNVTIAVVVRSLEQQFAELIKAGVENNKSELLKETTNKLLTVQRQNRKQIKLVPESSLYTRQLQDVFDGQLGHLENEEVEDFQSKLERVVACHIVHSDSSLVRLNQELIASYSIPERKSVTDIDALSVLDDSSQAKNDKEEIASECKAVTEQLHAVLEAYENLYDKHSVLSQWNEKKKGTIKSLKSQLKKLQKKSAENEALMYEINLELAQARLSKQSRLMKLSTKIDKFLKSFNSNASKRQDYLLDLNLLKASDLFDADWYLRTYSDVAEANIDPAEHYLTSGAEEGRFPSLKFNGRDYIKRYPDVAKENVNPLVHYIKYGKKEGRKVSPAPKRFS